MRRLLISTLAVFLLASCTQGGSGAFSEPSASPSPVSPAKLDMEALAKIRDQLAGSLVTHTAGGHLEQSWGPGGGFTLAGPYRNIPAYLDGLDLLAAKALLAPGSGGAGLQAAVAQLAASTATEIHDLNGPNGGAYLVLARVAALSPPATCPSPGSPPGPDPTCQRAAFSDALKTGWYAPDTKSYFHVGDSTTVYRPVDAIGVGAALVVAGYDEHNDDKINAGSEIIKKEMSADFDQHFGLPYGLMTATVKGGRQPSDTNTRVVDAAGMAEMLLLAFNASREQQYLSYARNILEPLLEDRAGLRAHDGYVTGFDLRTSSAQGAPLDFLATALVLQAARHYDRDDGGRFARLEEAAAAAFLAGTTAADPTQGTAATLSGTTPSARSGLVTAVTVVALCDVIANPPGASPPLPGIPSPPSESATP
ncbi:MAG: hypothetical protein M3O87_04290 [Candidatus Dormibacteraeota bacterium]|nr:hypothetical protein [Candidatus Dormibacteraeota bacterium]